MQGYGPITVTPNTVSVQQVDPGADRVLISNRSVYDILVSFQATQPLSSTSCSPQWPVFVHAGDQVVYTLQNADKSPTPLLLGMGSYWSGNVWLCPIGRQTGLASNGTVSGSTQVYLLALHPGDETPTLAARPTNVDASSQPRVVTVPIAGGQLFTGAWNMASFVNQAFFGYSFGAPLVNPLTLPIYVYYAYLIPELGVNVNSGAKVVLQWQALANDGTTVLGSGSILTFQLQQLYDTTSKLLFTKDFLWAPPFPPVFLASIPANTKTVILQFLKAAGTSFTVDWNVGANIDPNNTNGPGSTGNQTVQYGLGSGGPY